MGNTENRLEALGITTADVRSPDPAIQHEKKPPATAARNVNKPARARTGKVEPSQLTPPSQVSCTKVMKIAMMA